MLKKDEEKNKDERNEIIKSIFELSQRIRYAEIFNDKAIKVYTFLSISKIVMFVIDLWVT